MMPSVERATVVTHGVTKNVDHRHRQGRPRLRCHRELVVNHARSAGGSDDRTPQVAKPLASRPGKLPLAPGDPAQPGEDDLLAPEIW